MKFLIVSVILLLGVFSRADLVKPEAPEQEHRQVFKIYGTEGPYSAIKDAADAFGAANNVRMEVIGTPMDKWKAAALKDADLIYSSSENSMDTYNETLGIIDPKSITSLFLRSSAILVRPGNPKKIKGIRDLIHRDHQVIILNGQGQVAMWEDIVGRLKNVGDLDEFRKHIAFTAHTVSEALQYWKNHEEVEAWVTFNNFGKEEDIAGDIVRVEKDLTIYRSMGAAVTTITNQRETGLKFIEFLKGSEAEKIFKAKGWFKKEK